MTQNWPHLGSNYRTISVGIGWSCWVKNEGYVNVVDSTNRILSPKADSIHNYWAKFNNQDILQR